MIWGTVALVVIVLGAVSILKVMSSIGLEDETAQFIENVAYSLVDVNNIRYEGYKSSTHKPIIESLFDEELATEIIGNLESKSANNFISLEDKFKEYEKLKEEAQSDTTGFNMFKGLDLNDNDGRIRVVDGERGIYTSDAEMAGYEIKICSFMEKLPTADYIGSLVGNPYYHFELDNYYMFKKDGKEVLRVKVRSKDEADPLIIEYTCRFNEQDKINQIDNIELIYSKLARVEDTEQ